jgi:hypothetical protein
VAIPAAGRNIPYQFPPTPSATPSGSCSRWKPTRRSNRITFHFTDTVTYGGAADGDKVPFDLAQSATRTASAPVNVPCDVEFVGHR